uniref:Uncharacterized protein n=1 Tax=Helianthus annuus TaxID=4232 RepID=A0A251VHT2_HELAN
MVKHCEKHCKGSFSKPTRIGGSADCNDNLKQSLTNIRVVVGKPHVAVPGPLDYLGVELIRYRSTDMPV